MSGTTIWGALSTPRAANGGVTYIGNDGYAPVIDINNLFFDASAKSLHIGVAGDFSGLSTINAHGQIDAFKVFSATEVDLGGTSAAAHTVSSSRGTAGSPLINVSGDFVGKFVGWGYTGATAAFKELGGMYVYATGVTATELGSTLRFATKVDNGALVSYLELDDTGAFSPAAAGISNLGKATSGWGRVYISGTISVTAGAQTINKSAGVFKVAAGAASATITNSFVSANSVVLAVLQTADATATQLLRVTPAAGSFQVVLNANAAAAVNVGFTVINIAT